MGKRLSPLGFGEKLKPFALGSIFPWIVPLQRAESGVVLVTGGRMDPTAGKLATHTTPVQKIHCRFP